ncbi:MAG: hypothetical protein AAB521_03245 [Patescibacteria group bacterium]
MRRKKIKRKKRITLLKIISFFIFLLIIFSGLYLAYSIILNEKIISPLAQRYVVQGGENISEELLKAKILFSSIKRASESSYLITLSDGGLVIISPSKNIKIQISSLQLILSRLTIEGKRVKLVDFRYDRPVVRL